MPAGIVAKHPARNCTSSTATVKPWFRIRTIRPTRPVAKGMAVQKHRSLRYDLLAPRCPQRYTELERLLTCRTQSPLQLACHRGRLSSLTRECLQHANVFFRPLATLRLRPCYHLCLQANHQWIMSLLKPAVALLQPTM